MLLKGWRIVFFLHELNEIAFAIVLAISESLEIVCPLEFSCFIGCLTFFPCIL